MSYLGYLHFQTSWAFTCFRPSLFGHRNMDNLQSLTLEYANAMTFFCFREYAPLFILVLQICLAQYLNHVWAMFEMSIIIDNLKFKIYWS